MRTRRVPTRGGKSAEAEFWPGILELGDSFTAFASGTHSFGLGFSKVGGLNVQQLPSGIQLNSSLVPQRLNEAEAKWWRR